jgi:hypothetical protein
VADPSFSDWFRAQVGAPLPVAIDASLVRTPGQDPEWRCWTSVDDTRLSPSALVVPALPDIGRDYVVAGRWGHGANAWAFYLVERRGAWGAFLRVPLGNVYADGERERASLLEGLGEYRRLRDDWQAEVAHLSIVYSMGQYAARAALRAGATEVTHEDFPVLQALGQPSPSLARVLSALDEALQGEYRKGRPSKV